MSFETGNASPSAESNTAEVPDFERKDSGKEPLAESIPAEVTQQTPEASVPAIPQSILDSQQLIYAAADSVREGFGNAIRQPAPADPANLITVPDFARSFQQTRGHAQEASDRETAADLAARVRMRGGLASMQRLVELGLLKQESVDQHQAKHADEY